MAAKLRHEGVKMEPGQKRTANHISGINFTRKKIIDYGLIRDIETTTASVHDNQVDLTKPGEVAYKDKGYFGTASRGFSATMRRSVRGHPIGIRDILHNKRISRKRAPWRKTLCCD